MLKPGDVLRYYYLWARQADDREESGRKARPVCLVVKTTADPASLFLFPLTSQRPDRSRIHLAVSEIECRRVGLDFPSWLILDEYNRVDVGQAYDFISTEPIGAFSPAFLRKVAILIKEASTKRRVRAVLRT
ncbi:hypothetical protein LJR231_002104 [Phyllobacterium sp. LjRoot231]|uniref:hypothetical protein n=1 Tax=Phyllobacterium sp. LjRoot231 TaxID=3342289 RepID=UPI003ECFD4F2